ncbi:hypothetical protein [Erythrobacter aureus]|uniref:hypothetical protein n=1 Tax=Erythrobacter aureus TaxID=2182384 RepID=UPI003A8EC16C
MKVLTAIIAASMLSACASGGPEPFHIGTKPPVRTVDGSAAVSKTMPAARFVMPKAARYIGSTRFDLKEVADAEIHLFVEPDAAGVVKRAWWIQFESYLPTVPNARYDFADTGWPLVTLGAMDLYYRARFGAAYDKPPKGSEAERVIQMVERAGYRFPVETFSAQFHKVVSDDARSEVLVIFIGDLADIGLSVEGVIAGGKDGAPMRLLHERVLEQAKRHVSIQR